jgi:predicted transposase YdaD
MANEHDSGYKLLFSHPEMVRDLITGYLPGDWVKDAQFHTLERVNASYITDKGEHRHDDMVWRLRVGETWLWIYLLMEFQSKPDRWMAVRMLVYLGLLAQDLIKQGALHRGKLPPILPIVLYNGETVWHAAQNVTDCFVQAPGGLQYYLPQMSYHLIDEARLKLHPEATVRNFSEALFRLEHGRTPQDIRKVLQALDPLLRDEASQPLRRAFGVWVKSLLRRKVPKPKLSEVDAINDIMEADNMLADRIEGWFEEAERKGLESGMRKGMAQGIEQGMQQGMQQGESRLFRRLLERRFGPLPEWVEQRLQDASTEQLEQWAESLLDADSLEAVLGQSDLG